MKLSGPCRRALQDARRTRVRLSERLGSMQNNQRPNQALCRGCGAGHPLESMRLGIVDVTHKTKIASNLNAKFLRMNVLGVNNEHRYDETAGFLCPLFDH